MALDRRQLMGAIVAPAVAASVVLLDPARARAAAAETTVSPATLASDEDFWRDIQGAFAVDRSLINLNNGAVSPAPTRVQTAMRRHWAAANAAPAHNLVEVQNPMREPVRAALASAFGCHADEMAITRNASESLQIVQFGLDLGPGDEVLTTTQDYPRMITAFDQRQRRDGVVLRQIRLPVPAEDPTAVVRRFARAITPRTKLILACHMINLTGQIMPIRALVAMARARGIPVLVDGAHAFGHIPFRQADLGCDYYAASLHKWLNAPHGTGMLYVRQPLVGGLWPLMAAPAAMDHDIRKFEEVGTQALAPLLAIADALAFHRDLGVERKAARLRYLRERWLDRVALLPGVRVLTSRDPRFVCGMATVGIEGLKPLRLAHRLWRQHRILVAGIQHPDVEGIRVSPSIYNTLDEVDRFAEVFQAIARQRANRSAEGLTPGATG